MRRFLLFGVLVGIGVASLSPRSRLRPVQPPLAQPPALATSTPFERWYWAYSLRAYPLGYIPPGAYLRARRQIRRHSPARQETGHLLAQTRTDRWIPIGPSPISGGQVGRTTGARDVSGRVSAVAVDPAQDSHWIVGGAQGGLWGTRDAGRTWTPLAPDAPSQSIGAIAFAPGDPSIVYAGTGESAGNGEGGAGILRSADGGRTWESRAEATFSDLAFAAIRVDPRDPDTLVAAVQRGAFGRIRRVPLVRPETGIARSTDGGLTWTVTLTGEGSDLETDPGDPDRMLAALGATFGAGENGVYRSLDGGQTWNSLGGPWFLAQGGIGRVELALALSDPNTLYVSIQDAIGSGGTDGGLMALWRTDNAWDPVPDWIEIPAGATDDGTGNHGFCGWDPAFASASDQCWYNHDLLVDPADPSTLYAGGIGLWRCSSCDLTPQWEEISRSRTLPGGGIHADQQALAWSGNRLVVGNDGGVWSLLMDGSSHWANHNVGLSITQFYDGSVHPSDPNRALGGAQDNGTSSWGPDGWALLLGGDGADNAFSLRSPETRLLLSSQRLGLRRLSEIGSVGGSDGIDKTGAPFIARFEMCPANEDVFIAGTDNLWRSQNVFSATRPSWISNGPEMESGITALAFAESDPDCSTYAFGTANGQLRWTSDGGTTWQDIDPAGAVPDRAVTDLAFQPGSPDILWVALSGFDEGTPEQPGHLFLGRDLATDTPDWTDLSPPVNLPANSVLISPADPARVFLGTDIGVWHSPDGGATWSHMGPATGMPNVAVYDLASDPQGRRILAFTHGRGAFALETGDPIERERLYFPQFGDGGAGPSRISSQVFLLNPDEREPATGSLWLQDDDAAPLQVQLNGAPSQPVTRFTVQPLGVTILGTGGTGPLQAGSARITSDRPLKGVVLFGGPTGLAGVDGGLRLTDSFLLPVEIDQAGGINTGIALRNLGSRNVSARLVLLDSQGQQVSGAILPQGRLLPPSGHLAQFLTEVIWVPEVDLSSFTGIVRLEPTGPVAATALRLEPGELATLPVVPLQGAHASASRTLDFAQFGDGRSGATQISSRIFLLNPDSQPATATLTLRDDTGAPLHVDLAGKLTAGSLTVEVPAAGLQVLSSDGQGPLQVGSVEVVSDRPLAGVILFSGSSGTAGVGAGLPLANGFLAPVEQDSATGTSTGVAIMNLEEGPVTLTLELHDTTGTLLGTASLGPLPGGGHRARLLEELSWNPPLDLAHLQGLLKVDASGRIAATAIQVRPGQFATLPVLAR